MEKQPPSLGVIEGGALSEEQIVAEAYSHVARGYANALEVIGLPPEELSSLRACQLAALQIASERPLSALQAPS